MPTTDDDARPDPELGKPFQDPVAGLLEVLDGEAARVRCAAFGRLLADAAAVDVATLAAATGLAPDQIASTLDHLAATGAITLDPTGAVVAAGGLSVTPAGHRLRLGGRQFWTWCAFDGIGIPAALDLDAILDTQCPHCHQPIQVAIASGRPPAGSPVVGWLPGGPCGNVQADFCPDANLFCNDAHLTAWRTAADDPPGTTASLLQLADTGRRVWADLT